MFFQQESKQQQSASPSLFDSVAQQCESDARIGARTRPAVFAPKHDDDERQLTATSRKCEIESAKSISNKPDFGGLARDHANMGPSSSSTEPQWAFGASNPDTAINLALPPSPTTNRSNEKSNKEIDLRIKQGTRAGWALKRYGDTTDGTAMHGGEPLLAEATNHGKGQNSTADGSEKVDKSNAKFDAKRKSEPHIYASSKSKAQGNILKYGLLSASFETPTTTTQTETGEQSRQLNLSQQTNKFSHGLVVASEKLSPINNMLNRRKNRIGYVPAPNLIATSIEQQLHESHGEAIECRHLRYQASEIDLLESLSYKQKEILHGINLTVPKGCIYGLLGPSGCGKTTMLRCVAGRLSPSSGFVRVFGFRPGERGCQIPGPSIGYMPQELSIYEEFTINETLQYFGRINRMSRNLLKERIKFLINFLDLPDKRRKMRTLSGGQKRRVSFAAALVHSPPLLILDEPTVGIDPLLRETIWNYLVKLASLNKITVVITTHYIEEARQANFVGLMRRGNLLVEDSPENLLIKYNTTSLESVFLFLCMQDKRAEQDKIGTDNLIEDNVDSKKLARKDSSHELGFNMNQNFKSLSLGQSEVEMNHLKCQSEVKSPLAIEETTVITSASTEESNILESAFDRNKLDTLDWTPVFCPNLINAGQVTMMIDDERADNAQHLSIDKNTVRPSEKSSDSMEQQQRSFNSQERLEQATPDNERNWQIKDKKLVSGNNTFLAWFEVFLAVTWKNYLRLKRNPPVIVFEFVLPAFQVLLFCLCIGGEPSGVPMAIVNEESSPQASRLFLNSINNQTINQIKYDSLDEALKSVKLGKTWGVVHIPERYTHHLQDRLIHPADADNVTLSNGTINIYPDLTNLHLALSMENTFREAFIKFARETLDLFGYDPELASLPINVGKPIYGGGYDTKPSYLEFMAPGVVVSITYVMATGLTALAFILEKRDGLLERSLMSGVTTSQMLLSHVSIQVIVMIFQIGLVLLVTFYVFKIPSQGPLYLVVLLILLQGCTGMAFGLIISAVCNEENTAVMMLVGTFYINLILAGIIWPLEAMPIWLRVFSYMQPQTLPVESLRCILSRGWGIDEPTVYIGFAVTLGWLIVFLVGAGVCMRYLK